MVSNRTNRFTADVHIILESEIQGAFRLKQHSLIALLDLEKAYNTLLETSHHDNIITKQNKGNRSFRVVLVEL
jgi:hypothetical protein